MLLTEAEFAEHVLPIVCFQNFHLLVYLHFIHSVLPRHNLYSECLIDYLRDQKILSVKCVPRIHKPNNQ